MHRSNKGFTLVEILIVVIILGILAAIVIPQFTEASNDARESALASDLQTLRSQIELYKIQHLDAYPGEQADGSIDATEFVTDLTTQTDQNGDAGGNLGPYLQSFPGNPFQGDDNTVRLGESASGDAGWFFDPNTGKISPNDSDHEDL
jgi:general secretion pathway protein G